MTGFAIFGAHGGIGMGNAGRPAPITAVRILAADGTECPDGEAGEICVRGDLVHCRRRIASYKKPKTVEFIDALPKLHGVLKDYATLDEKFGGGGYPGGDSLGGDSLGGGQ